MIKGNVALASGDRRQAHLTELWALDVEGRCCPFFWLGPLCFVAEMASYLQVL